MRSIARWVLPVLVGPSTAVTPAPGARSLWNAAEGEKAIFFGCFYWAQASASVLTPAYLQKCLTLRRIWGCGLSSGTTLERKAPESPTPPPVPLRSPQHPAPAPPCRTRSSLQRFHKQPFGAAILKITGCTESNQNRGRVNRIRWPSEPH